MTTAVLEKQQSLISIREQSQLVRDSLIHLATTEAWKDDRDADDAAAYLRAIQSNTISPSLEYDAFKLCRKYWRNLKKANINLPTQKDWQATYHLKDMQVWNLTKRTGPYTLEWLGDEALSCDCPAYETGNECGHVRFAESQLGLADSVGNAVVSMPAPAPVVVAPTVSDVEMLPGVFATEGQAIALDNLLKFARGEKGLTYLLTGKAGSGKTLLVQALIHKLRSQNDDRKIVFTAPTNKATKVLETMVAQWGLNVECMTCAKLLGLKPSWDPDSGKEVFERDWKEDSAAGDYDLIVVDEASMTSEELFGFLMAEVNIMTRFLFMGDPCQLPPVNEAISNAFTEVPDQSNLVEIKRYSGAIAEVVADARENLSRRGKGTYETNQADGAGVFVVNARTWMAQLIKAFKSDTYAKNHDAVKALAYTNKRVDQINSMVREAIRGKNAERFEVGDRLIAKNHYSLNDSHGSPVKVMSTADEMEVLGARVGTSGRYKYWALDVQVFGGGRAVTVPVLHEDSFKDFQLELRELKKAKNWPQFYNLKYRFADLKYAYCITTHSAQGSTYENCFVDVPNIRTNNTRNMVMFPGADKEQLVYERNQLLYVAFSRASKRLFLID